ncbi:hypothetical protein LZ32DRAFT_651172 [Colletotrichum eremochloae]|nr:hypothetical protein LZ32DRAFT_651172 [Colletotrichum eremochloae]
MSVRLNEGTTIEETELGVEDQELRGAAQEEGEKGRSMESRRGMEGLKMGGEMIAGSYLESRLAVNAKWEGKEGRWTAGHGARRLRGAGYAARYLQIAALPVDSMSGTIDRGGCSCFPYDDGCVHGTDKDGRCVGCDGMGCELRSHVVLSLPRQGLAFLPPLPLAREHISKHT